MKVRLLAPHIILDTLHEKNEIIDNILPKYVTSEMEGLDNESRELIAELVKRTYGRHPGVAYGLPTSSPLLDDPPIRRPLDDNQPVYHFVGRKEYIS